MAYPVQRPEFSQALARLYGLKGDARVEALAQLYPTLPLVGALDQTPYSEMGLAVMGTAPYTAPGAGVWNTATVRPATGQLLQVRRIIVTNSGAATAAFRFQAASQSTITATYTNPIQLFPIQDTDADMLNAPAPAFIAWGQVAGAPLLNSMVAPDLVLAVNATGEVDFPPDCSPIIGPSNGGIIVTPNLANQAYQVGFICRMWPAPG